ncbi:hypothetical protein Tco_0767516 [Tanacetum coccineum]
MISFAPTLTHKLFSNMRRDSKGYTGVDTPLFQTMLVQGQALQGEGPTIPVESHHIPTSAPSTSQPPSSPPSMQTTHVAEEAAPMPYESPLPRVHSLRSDKGSMTLNELTPDDIQVSDQPEEQLGVFSAVKVLADAAEQRRGVENVQTYTRRRAVHTGSGRVSTAVD